MKIAEILKKMITFSNWKHPRHRPPDQGLDLCQNHRRAGRARSRDTVCSGGCRHHP